MSLTKGLKAVEEQQYAKAIELLTDFCDSCSNYHSHEYIQAKVGLARAYYGVGEREPVIYICRELAASETLSVRQWAQQWLNAIQATPKYTLEQLNAIFEEGQQALRDKNYPQAINLLEEYCHHNHQLNLLEVQQAKMWLVQAYTATRDTQNAMCLCEELNWSQDTMIQNWAKEKLPNLKLTHANQENNQYLDDNTYLENEALKTASLEENISAQLTVKSKPLPKRSLETKITLKKSSSSSNLFLAISITLVLIFLLTLGSILMVAWLLNFFLASFAFLSLVKMAIALTVIVDLIALFTATKLLDSIYENNYNIRWVNISEISYYSQEASETIQNICRDHNLNLPRLGIINDPTPVAFTYGVFPNKPRIVLTKGLFSCLKKDEEAIATVYAHELGHIVDKDVWVITFGYSLINAIHILVNSITKPKDQQVVMPSFIYNLGTYFLFYLSRIREHHADYFAVKTTGNPNALIRALLKIAQSIITPKENITKSNKLLVQTRLMGIYDYQMAISAGVACPLLESNNVGRIFTWDIVNPAAKWLELNAPHPLIGKRLRVLTNYAQQLNLYTQLELEEIIQEEKQLNRKKSNHNLWLDLIILNLPIIGLIGGIIIGVVVYFLSEYSNILASLPLFSLGLSIIIKSFLMYSGEKKIKESKIMSLIYNSSINPVKGERVEISGKLIGTREKGSLSIHDLKIQDRLGIINLRHCPREIKQSNFPLGTQVKVSGWFRRGVGIWLDLKELTSEDDSVKTYYNLRAIAIGSVWITLAVLIMLKWVI